MTSASASISKVRILWHWQSNDNPWSLDEKPDWKPYSDVQNEFIEQAYQEKCKTVKLENHIIDFDKNLQINQRDDTKQRPIKRLNVEGNDDYLREARFFSFPQKAVKTFVEGQGMASPFLGDWLKLGFADFDGPYAHRPPDECGKVLQILIPLTVNGILQEGQKIGQGFEAKIIAGRLEEIKSRLVISSHDSFHKTMQEMKEQCVKFYTAESFLYRLVNMTLREDDRSKVQTLGPFVYFLSTFIHSGYSQLDQIGMKFEGTVYRGAQLDEKMVNEYKSAIGEERKWLGYSSTSKNRRLAETFGNTLFIIKIIKVRQNTNWDVSSLSVYPNEEEVLLTAGVSFVIDKVECNDGKYLIYLTIKRGW
jgi:hypothetical protein